MHELAFGMTGLNSYAGTAPNTRYPDFTPSRSSSGSAAAVDRMRTMFESIDSHDYTSCCAAICDMDMRNIASLNPLKTLIIAGTQDFATPVSESEFLLSQYHDATLVEFDAGHLSNIEQAQNFNEHVLTFLLAAP